MLGLHRYNKFFHGLVYVQKCNKKEVLTVYTHLLHTPQFDYSVQVLQGSWILLPLNSPKYSTSLKCELQKDTETLKPWL